MLIVEFTIIISHLSTPFCLHDSYAPPDTIGAVGLNHYVQMVNVEYAVYNKTTGEAIVTPRQINSLWAGSSANNPQLRPCEVQNAGTSVKFGRRASVITMTTRILFNLIPFCCFLR